MNRKDFSVTTAMLIGLLGLIASPTLAQERTVDPTSVPTRTCQALINDNVKAELPKAKGIAWNMDSVRESDVKGGVLLTGSGNYQGGSARRRYDFECTFDTAKNKVVSAWWVSTFDRKGHIVVAAPGSDATKGWTEAQITNVCRSAVRAVAEDEFPSTVRRFSFLDETIERSVRGSVHELSGEGRMQGGGGTWRRFSFGCTFDAGTAQVTEATWRHLGAESDLDLD